MAPPCSPPVLMDDLIAEILLRISPDEPADLVRAALVCKTWRRIISDPAFPRRYREFHRTPPLLGFFHVPVREDSRMPFIAVTTASPYSLTAPEFRLTFALDCRHGRMLLYTDWDVMVWDPITNERHHLDPPHHPMNGFYIVAVLCAADVCDHLDCSRRPFRVVYVASDDNGSVVSGSIYSSEARMWSARTFLQLQPFLHVGDKPSLLIGDALYVSLKTGKRIIKYDLTEGILSAIDLPELYKEPYDIVLTVEDGGLGFACLKHDILYLWSWQTGLNGVAGWARRRAIELKMLLPDCAMPTTSFRLNGFVESAYTIFVSTDVGVFTIELKSARVKKVAEGRINGSIIPYTSFCTPDLAEARLPSP